MLKECLDVFERYVEHVGERHVLDSHVPKDGLYMLIRMDEDAFTLDEGLEIRRDKKTGHIIGSTDHRYLYIRKLDYESQLVSMNKPIDSKKTIHSNSYYTFFIKKESVQLGKVKPEIIRNYYAVLRNPLLKYDAKKESRLIYQNLVEEIGEPDEKEIDLIQAYVERLLNELNIDWSKKDYLKLFFVYPDEEKTRQAYERENRRYLAPNIYNSNEYNQYINKTLLGLQDNNMGLNSKKPFLLNRTRINSKVPKLVEYGEAKRLADLFTVLGGYAAQKKYCIYFDEKNARIEAYGNNELPQHEQSGYFMRISAGIETAIIEFDTLPQYSPLLDKSLVVRRIIPVNDEQGKSKESITSIYRIVTKKSELMALLDDCVFYKRLFSNLFLDSKDVSIKEQWLKYNVLLIRDKIIDWAYKNESRDVYRGLDRVINDVISETISLGYLKKAAHQFNLRFSLQTNIEKRNKEEEKMNKVLEDYQRHLEAIEASESWNFDSDSEYYFALGQIIYYLASQSKSIKNDQSVFKPFLSTNDNAVLKEDLSRLYLRFAHALSLTARRFNNVYAMVSVYEPKAGIDKDYLRMGILYNNFFYQKSKKGD